MAVYRVWAKMTTYCYIDVEAEDEEAALEFAEDADGGDYINSNEGDWEILDDEVEKLS